MVRAVIQFLRSILKLRTRCAKIKKAARIVAVEDSSGSVYGICRLVLFRRCARGYFNDTQKLLTCQYVKEAFESAVPLCDETISNLTYLWRGNSIVATALFGLWIALLLAVQRLSNKHLLVKNMMGAMKSFKAMKAGGKGSFLGGKVEIPRLFSG